MRSNYTAPTADLPPHSIIATADEVYIKRDGSTWASTNGQTVPSEHLDAESSRGARLVRIGQGVWVKA